MSKPLNAILLVLAAVLLVPIVSYSAGLGAITVRSALGQPLDAEIEVLSLRAGQETFQVRLAPRETYRSAGAELSPALAGARFAVENRGGKTLIRVTTTQPVNDPYLELMVELHFPTGRLARQYTVLVDPVEYKVASTPAPAVASAPSSAPAVTPVPQAAAVPTTVPAASSAPAVVAAPAPAPAVIAPAPAPAVVAAPAPAPAVIAPEPAPAVVAAPTPAPAVIAPAPAPAVVAAPAPAPAVVAPSRAMAVTPALAPAVASVPAQQDAETYRIKRGDTLGAIARKWKPEGVTIHQMMIGLYQINPSVFIRDNINLIRAGATLFIPGREEVLAIRDEDALQQVRIQMAEFNKYRRVAAAGSTRSAQAQRDIVSRRVGVKKSTRSM